jgi:hypothetical protein
MSWMLGMEGSEIAPSRTTGARQIDQDGADDFLARGACIFGSLNVKWNPAPDTQGCQYGQVSKSAGSTVQWLARPGFWTI